MIKKYFTFFLSVAFLFTIVVPCQAETKWDQVIDDASLVFEEMTYMPDDSIPESLLKKCQAIAIFPSTLSGGFIFGGKYGNGILLARDVEKGTWCSPAVFRLIGGSFGWQIGGQAIDIVLLIMSERGLRGLLASSCKLGAEVGLAAGPLGRDVTAETDLQLKGGILSYSKSRGLFAGAKLQGAVLSFNYDANALLYGQYFHPIDLISLSSERAPDSAKHLLAQLQKYA